jgi:hypothetical protein
MGDGKEYREQRNGAKPISNIPLDVESVKVCMRCCLLHVLSQQRLSCSTAYWLVMGRSYFSIDHDML